MKDLDALKAGSHFYLAWATEQNFQAYAKKNFSEEIIMKTLETMEADCECVVRKITHEASTLQGMRALARQDANTGQKKTRTD